MSILLLHENEDAANRTFPAVHGKRVNRAKRTTGFLFSGVVAEEKQTPQICTQASMHPNRTATHFSTTKHLRCRQQLQFLSDKCLVFNVLATSLAANGWPAWHLVPVVAAERDRGRPKCQQNQLKLSLVIDNHH
jgi:hypothetical protein